MIPKISPTSMVLYKLQIPTIIFKCEAIFFFLLQQAVNLIVQLYFLDYMTEVYVVDVIQCLFLSSSCAIGLIHIQEGSREAEGKMSEVY